MSQSPYLHHLSNKEFLFYFYIKLEKKLKTILELRRYLKEKNFIFDKDSSVYHYSIMTSPTLDETYLIGNIDYIIGNNNETITVTEDSLKKLYLTLLSETVNAIFLFENSLSKNDTIKPFIDFINSLFVAVNDLHNDNEVKINEALLVIERIKHDI